MTFVKNVTYFVVNLMVCIWEANSQVVKIPISKAHLLGGLIEVWQREFTPADPPDEWISKTPYSKETL